MVRPAAANTTMTPAAAKKAVLAKTTDSEKAAKALFKGVKSEKIASVLVGSNFDVDNTVAEFAGKFGKSHAINVGLFRDMPTTSQVREKKATFAPHVLAMADLLSVEHPTDLEGHLAKQVIVEAMG